MPRSAAALILLLFLAPAAPRAKAGEPETAAPAPKADGSADVESNGAGRAPERQLRLAQWYLADNPAQALVEFDRFLAEYPEHELAGEAQFGRGRSLNGLGRLLEAFEAVEKSFPKKPLAQAVSERCELELAIARRLAAFGDELLAPPATAGGKKKETGTEAASRVFAAVVYNDPLGLYAPEALMGLGDTRRRLGRPAEAAEAYLQLVGHHPKSLLVEAAKIRAARALLEMPFHNDRGIDPVAEAERWLQEARGVSLDGRSALAGEWTEASKELENRKAEQQMKQAEYYLRSRKAEARASGLFLLREVIRLHPQTPAAAAARERLGAMGEAVEAKTPQ